jgi:hypothetical protein
MQEINERGENLKLNKLKGKLVEREMSYEKCANSLEISITAFNNKMNGHSKFYIEEAKQLGDILNMTQQEKIDIFLN